MKIKKLMVFTLLVSILVLAAGCGENNDSAKNASQTGKTTAASTSSVFEFYNKVELNKTKDEIDRTLAVTPSVDSHSDNIYEYYDPKTNYGVSVMYDKNNLALSKTVLYGSHSDIAPLCKKSVTQDQANKISTGMTYAQVKEMLGGDGVEVNQTKLSADESKPSLMRRWANKDGSCIQVSFKTDDTVSFAYYYGNYAN